MTVFGLFVLGMLTMMYLITYGPHWSGFPLLLDGAWRFAIAGLPAGFRASWHWLVGWTRPYVPAGTQPRVVIATQSRLVHAIVAHWGRLVVVTAGLLLIFAFLWAGQVFTAFWVFVPVFRTWGRRDADYSRSGRGGAVWSGVREA